MQFVFALTLIKMTLGIFLARFRFSEEHKVQGLSTKDRSMAGSRDTEITMGDFQPVTHGF
jgi:hypothetical protein